jgi:hypothetical protein
MGIIFWESIYTLTGGLKSTFFTTSDGSFYQYGVTTDREVVLKVKESFTPSSPLVGFYGYGTNSSIEGLGTLRYNQSECKEPPVAIDDVPVDISEPAEDELTTSNDEDLFEDIFSDVV